MEVTFTIDDREESYKLNLMLLAQRMERAIAATYQVLKRSEDGTLNQDKTIEKISDIIRPIHFDIVEG